MKLYLYRKDTKEYFGTAEANIDPLESLKAGEEVYAIPPFSTVFPPIETDENRIKMKAILDKGLIDTDKIILIAFSI